MNNKLTFLRNLMAIFSLSLMAFSCSEEMSLDQVIGSDERVPITFSVSVDAATRGSIIGSANFDSFTLYAYEEGSESAFIDGATFTLSDGVWSSTDSYFWPTDNTAMIKFYAYTPVGATAATNGFSFNQGTISYDMASIDNKNLPDITTAYAEQSAGNVALSFSRAMAILQFKVSGDDTDNAVTRVSVSNIVAQGDYDIAQEEWTTSGAISVESYSAGIIEDVTPSGADEETLLTESDGYIMVIPQSSSNQVKITVEIENKVSKEFTLSEVDWKEGYIYTYTMDSDTFEFVATGVELRRVYNYGEDDESESAADANDTITISVGESVTLRAVILPEGAASQDLYWTPSGDMDAVDSEYGSSTYTVTGLSAGTINVAVGLSFMGSDDSCEIVIEEENPDHDPASGLINLDVYSDDSINTAQTAYKADLEIANENNVTSFVYTGSSNIYLMNMSNKFFTNITASNITVDISAVVPNSNDLSASSSMYPILSHSYLHYFFEDASNIQTIILPTTTDGYYLSLYYTFENCTSLKYLSPTDQILYLKGSSFSGCSSLESLDLPLAEVISTNSFKGCTSLKTLKLTTTSSIGFIKSSSSSAEYGESNFETYAASAFTDFDTTQCTLYLHSNNYANISSATTWAGLTWSSIVEVKE